LSLKNRLSKATVRIENGISRSGRDTGLYLEKLAVFYEDGNYSIMEIMKYLETGNTGRHVIAGVMKWSKKTE